jgi:hypothetical protein
VVTAPPDLKFRHPSHQPEGEGDVQIYDIKALLEADNPAADSLTELSPEAAIPFGVNVAWMILSDDGRFRYALLALPDAPNTPTKLVRIDTSTDAADLELDLEQGATAFCLSPGGSTLFVAVSPQGHAYSNRSRPEEGTLFMVNAETFEVSKTTRIELDPSDIQANDKGHVYVSGGSNPHTLIGVVDMKKTRAIVSHWKGVTMGSCIRLSSDQKRLYIASRKISPARVACWVLPTCSGGSPIISTIRNSSQTPLGGEIFLTPDDTFVLTRFGAVVSLGAQRTAKTERSRSSSTKVSTPMPKRLSPR